VLDQLAEKYYSASPYCYVLNTPINAIDPDGRLVIFVTGYPKKVLSNYGISPYPPIMRFDSNDTYLNDHSMSSLGSNYWERLDQVFQAVMNKGIIIVLLLLVYLTNLGMQKIGQISPQWIPDHG
jgi:hypothetical protein